MDGAAIADVWEVCIKDGINYSPDEIYGNAIIISHRGELWWVVDGA